MYKLAAEEVDGVMQPRIKISENPAKITNPGLKKLYRVYDKKDGRALADLIALADEVYDEREPLTLFDPENTWKTMTVTDYTLRPLLEPVFRGGRLVYDLPALPEIRAYAARELSTLWEEYKRLHKPHLYKVDLSRPLWTLKRSMLDRD